MTLGQRIQKLRKGAGLTQEQLAERMGVTRQAVSKWESDGGVPELDTLIADYSTSPSVNCWGWKSSERAG